MKFITLSGKKIEMRKFHLTPQLIFSLFGGKKEKIKYAFSFDYKNLALTALTSLKNPGKLLTFAGLNFYKGTYLWKGEVNSSKKTQKVLVANAGVYSPDTAIGTEILCFLGANYLIKVGCCGSLRKDIKIGELVIANQILDDTGVTKFYPARIKIDRRLNEKIQQSLSKFKIHKGKVWSYDALFREEKSIVKEKIEKGAIAVDMSLASFFKVASFYEKKAGSVLVVSDNLITGEIGFRSELFRQKLSQLIKNIFKVLEIIELQETIS